MKWVLLVSAISLTVVGHVVYKTFSERRVFVFLVAAVVLLLGAAFSTYGAIRMGLSVAQVYMTTALVPVMMLLVGKYWFHEDVGVHHYIGVALVVLGVAVFYY